jgi:predicted  nucleic acid-binding Zn-ribbon protein
MRPFRSQPAILPKISTMPRQKTEATLYRSLYQLAVEKKRLQEELVSLGQRLETVTQRLEQIENQIQGLETDVKQIAQPKSPETKPAQPPALTFTKPKPGSVSTFTLEY